MYVSRENVKCMSPNSLYSAHCDNTTRATVTCSSSVFASGIVRPSLRPTTHQAARNVSLLRALETSDLRARWCRGKVEPSAMEISRGEPSPSDWFCRLADRSAHTTDKRYTIRSGDIGLSGERAQPQIDMQWPPRILRRHFSETAPTTNW